MPRYELTATTTDPASLYVEIGRGDVRVTCRDADADPSGTTTVTVEGRDADRVDVHDRDGQVNVLAPRGGLLSAFDSPLHVTVELPAGSNVAVKLGSADATVGGPAGAVRLRTGSGDVRVEGTSAPSTIDCGSGDVRVGRSGAELSIRTGSGDVAVEEAADELAVSTGSGDLRVDRTSADVGFTSGSGSVVVASTGGGRVTAKSASGDVRVGVTAGTPVWTDISSLTGRIHSGLAPTGQPIEGQEHVEVRATTVSGNVSLVEA